MINRYMNRLLLILGVSLLGLSACVTQLDNPLELQPQLVINGVFNNSAGQRQVSVLLVNDLDGNGQKLDATGSIYKDGQLSADLISNGNGDLELPEGYMIEAGAEYFIELVTNGNKVYRSIPQVVAPKYETEEISWEVVEDVDRPFFRGDPIVRSTIEFFAHVNLPDAEVDKRFYRWVVDESWDFHESPISDTICYLSKSVSDYSASLLTNASNLLQVGQARKSVAIRDFDNSFAETHYFNVYLHSLDARTYEFYAKSERLTSGTGTIYDEVPGPFRGNISNIDDPEEVVLGWVEFFLADTLRARLSGDDFRAQNFFVSTQCNQTGAPGPCPPQITPPGGGLPPPCQCLDCQEVLGEDALNPPFYWED